MRGDFHTSTVRPLVEDTRRHGHVGLRLVAPAHQAAPAAFSTDAGPPVNLVARQLPACQRLEPLPATTPAETHVNTPRDTVTPRLFHPVPPDSHTGLCVTRPDSAFRARWLYRFRWQIARRVCSGGCSAGSVRDAAV